MEEIPEDLAELVQFFLEQARNRTWCEKHPKLVKQAIKKLTEAQYNDKLSIDLVHQIAAAIQHDWEVFEPHLHLNITSGKAQVSSLLLASASPLFRERLLTECLPSNSRHLNFKAKHFDSLLEAMNKGQIDALWKWEKEDVHILLEEAQYFEIPALIDQCEEVLARYINRANAAEMLEMAIIEELDLLQKAIFDFLNNLQEGVQFSGCVTLKFLEFQPHSIALFEKFAHLITHLKFTADLPGKAPFNTVIDATENLIGIDLTGTHLFSDRLTLLPENLLELNLSQCTWLSDERLQILLKRCPDLTSLALVDNTQLTERSWSLLYSLKNLKKLDLSGCDQIDDLAFTLILRACRHIRELKLKDSVKITSTGFYEIAKAASNLRTLDVARCLLSDAPLVEIATRCEKLTHVDISSCPNVSLKVPSTLKRLAPKLELIHG